MKSYAYASLFAGAALAAPVAQFSTGVTTNDLVGGACKPVTLLFARGSTEGGNMGLAVGPALANAMGQAFGAGNVAIQGIDYPADIAGAITGAMLPTQAPGAKKMAELARGSFTSCPTTKLVLSGYSQGAEQVHGALSILGPDAPKIAAVVTFGDPLKLAPFAGIEAAKTKTYCADGDGVCLGGFNFMAHVSYGVSSVTPAATWVKGVIGGAAAPTAGSPATPAAAPGAPAGAVPVPAALPSAPAAAGGLGALAGLSGLGRPGAGAAGVAGAAGAVPAAAAQPTGAARPFGLSGLRGMLSGLRSGRGRRRAGTSAPSGTPTSGISLPTGLGRPGSMSLPGGTTGLAGLGSGNLPAFSSGGSSAAAPAAQAASVAAASEDESDEACDAEDADAEDVVAPVAAPVAAAPADESEEACDADAEEAAAGPATAPVAAPVAAAPADADADEEACEDDA